MADVTRSSKQGHQWPHEKDLCPPNFFFKKEVFFSFEDRMVIPWIRHIEYPVSLLCQIKNNSFTIFTEDRWVCPVFSLTRLGLLIWVFLIRKSARSDKNKLEFLQFNVVSG